MVSYMLFLMVLVLIFVGVIGAVITICYDDPHKRTIMTAEDFNKVVEAINNGKSDEEIMDTLYVDKRDINIVKSILAKHAKEKLNGN